MTLITISGEFTDIYGIDIPGPYVITFAFDETAIADLDPSPQHGLYVFPTPLALDFGSDSINASGVQIEIYHGYSGLTGVAFGNSQPIEYRGFTIDIGYLYTSFLSTGNTLASDSFSELYGFTQTRNSYSTVSGAAASGDIFYLQDNGLSGYTVGVPEPSVMALMVVSLWAIARRSSTRSPCGIAAACRGRVPRGRRRT